MMKKTMTLLLSLSMICCLAACGNSAGQTGSPSAESSSATGNDAGNSTGEDTQTESGAEDGAEAQGSKVLVAYFSATGTTKGVAEHIANGLHADIYEIIPEESYTDADLDYSDNNSRSTIEMNDVSSRPAISGSVENMEQYDVVFIGFPIWWGEAPRIVSTFVESYDFAGKTIVPFCTSGGSGVGSSATNLEALTGGATWMEGRRLGGSDSQDTVMEWVNGLDLHLGECEESRSNEEGDRGNHYSHGFLCRMAEGLGCVQHGKGSVE